MTILQELRELTKKVKGWKLYYKDVNSIIPTTKENLQSYNGLIHTMECFLEMVEYLLEMGVPLICIYKFNQDCLEVSN